MFRHYSIKFILPVLLFLSACNQQAEELTGKVTGVKDGDTIEVLINGTPQRIRLAEIDCPERGQPYAQVAKHFTSDACFGKQVKVLPVQPNDQYGRIVATVTVDDTLVLNKALLSAGLAWHYKHFSENEEYAVLEYNARENKLGIWEAKRPTPPWQWRKNKRDAVN